jgi:hypothetical protein
MTGTVSLVDGQFLLFGFPYSPEANNALDLDLSALREVVTIDGYPDLYFPSEERARLLPGRFSGRLLGSLRGEIAAGH